MPELRGRRRHNQAWGATLALIGAICLVGAALLIVPGLIARPSDRGPNGQDVTQVAAVSFPPIGVKSVEWSIHTIDPTLGDAVATDIVVVGDRLVAIGSRNGRPLAWWSDDGGASWTLTTSMAAPSSPPTEGALLTPRSAATWGPRVVVAGIWTDPNTAEALGAVVWVSSDGRNWKASDLTDALPGVTLDEIVGTSAGFYATGHASRAVPSGWWSSPDGLWWVPLEIGGLPNLATLPPAIAWKGDLLVVAGGYGTGPDPHPGVWAADKGLEFKLVFDDEQKMGLITGVATARYGFVAAGQTVDDSEDQGQSRLAAWISADGRAWQDLGLETPSGTTSMGVAANISGAVIVGWSLDAQSQDLWFLPGGSGTPSVVRFPFFVLDIVGTPDTFVALGGCSAEDGCSGPMVAIGRASESQEALDPTLPPD